MIRRLAASAALVTFCLAGCGDRSKTEETPPPEAAVAAPSEKIAPPQTPAEAAPPVEASEVVLPAAPGAPTYAALYPGAALDQPATTAAGPDGEGGLVTFRTDATPDEVVAFYRDRAEQAGLTTVMGMNQGDARAYGAAGGNAGSTNLQVVAAPGEAGETSVQLSWSAGL
ncbi:hypothetical protein [Brevundimonas sp.]|jgi:hypothetical protein|uniref:hypothetical protein n=1 Tax=Brevundimonas sp. TaxID=1871086 RepID=UPI0037BE96DF